MKLFIISRFRSLIGLSLVCLIILNSCVKEEDSFPITNDLRVLKVNIDGKREDSGAAGLSVDSNIELIFSHSLNTMDLESALSISPDIAFNVSYDSSGSVVKILPNVRFEYETEYTITLPQGTYGVSGEKINENFNFVFSTNPFIAPKVSLVAEALSVFEGESLNVVANISNTIFDDVSFDLVFAGTAGDGIDYSVSVKNLVIPAGQSSASFVIEALADEESEGKETIIISLANVVNAVNDPPLQLLLDIGDSAPALILKGVMELDDFDLSGGQIRAVHLSVLQDIEDLSIYHIQIASNGAAADPLDIDFVFPSVSATKGDNLFVVRDLDAPLAATYFGSCYSSFTEFQTSGMTHNGDDAILLYKNGVAVDSYGEVGVDGTDQEWEYTNSWAYKFGENWVYAGVGCVENSVGDGLNETSSCSYPFCSSGLEFKGIMDLNHSGNNLRAYHLFALLDIPDLSIFGAGIASNGQATSDGVEIPFPNISVSAGEHILVIRDLDVANAQAYFGACYSKFSHVIPDGGVSSNGDDTIELFKNNALIETYGELGVDGTGMFWEYDNSWAYKVSGKWTYGGVGCSTDATANATSSCPYSFCD